MATILIVEDDPINLRVFSKILTKRGGFEVKATENGEEIIKLAVSGEIDLILMDISLTNSYYQKEPVDGIFLSKKLKEDSLTAHIPIILITAHAMEGDRQKFLTESGADGYITKPVVDHQEFVGQIKAML